MVVTSSRAREQLHRALSDHRRTGHDVEHLVILGTRGERHQILHDRGVELLKRRRRARRARRSSPRQKTQRHSGGRECENGRSPTRESTQPFDALHHLRRPARVRRRERRVSLIRGRGRASQARCSRARRSWRATRWRECRAPCSSYPTDRRPGRRTRPLLRGAGSSRLDAASAFKPCRSESTVWAAFA